MKIGFIGLGIMGESMCENIVKKSGKEVLVYDINIGQVEKLVNIGAINGESIEKISENCDVIISMLPTGKHVQDVYNRIIEVITPGKILIDMSTIEPSVSRELAAIVDKKGSKMIDAPVVKSKPAAISGQLGIYVGGDVNTYEQVAEILGYMGSNIIYMGDNGCGLVMKICHNMLVAQIQNGVNETIYIAEKFGLNIADVATAISYGGGQNFYLDSKKNSIENEDFKTAFSVQNMNKDINIAVNLAKEANVKLPGAEVARDVYSKAMENGLGKEDFSATIKIVRNN